MLCVYNYSGSICNVWAWGLHGVLFRKCIHIIIIIEFYLICIPSITYRDKNQRPSVRELLEYPFVNT